MTTANAPKKDDKATKPAETPENKVPTPNPVANTPAEDPKPTEAPKTAEYVVKAAPKEKPALKLRRTPEIGDNVLTEVKKGTELTAIEDDGEWTKVVAYVKSEFLEKA